jgi:hypothetical protein
VKEKDEEGRMKKINVRKKKFREGRFTLVIFVYQIQKRWCSFLERREEGTKMKNI